MQCTVGHIVRIILQSMLCLVLSIPGFASAAEAGTAKVLVVHSYHETDEWVLGVNEALTEGLSGQDINVSFLYMDTQRRPSLQWKQESGALVQERIETSRPDVIIAVDDSARDYAISPYIGKKWPLIVFCGVNSDENLHHYPPTNMTGIYKREYIHQTLDFLIAIQPDIQKVVYLSDDSITAQHLLRRARHYNTEMSLAVELTGFHTPSLFEEWQTLVSRYEDDAAVGGFMIPRYHSVLGADGKTMRDPAEIMRWIISNTTKPVVGLWPFSPIDGALAAVVVDPHEHGWVAARMVKKLLEGTPITDILPVVNKKGEVHLNTASASRLNLEISYDLLDSCDVIIE